MRKFFILVLLVSVLFSFCVNAESFVNVYLVNNESEISFSVGDSRSVSFLFENLFNETVFNVSCSGSNGLFDSFVIPVIPFGENVSRDVVFRGSSEFFGSESINCFFYFLRQFDSVPVVHDVYVLADRFEPESFEVRQGDSVVWFNNDSLVHTLVSGSFSLDVPVGGSNSRVFDSVGMVDYESLTIGFWGDFLVVNKTSVVSVHNSDYDFVKSVPVSVGYNQGLVDLELVESNLSVVWNGSGEGILWVANTGSVGVLNVSLSDSLGWLVFSRNGFDLGVGERKYSYFVVSPKIFGSNGTGQDYDLTVSVNAINSGSASRVLKVFVPYDSGVSFVDYSDVSREELFARVSGLKSELSDIIAQLNVLDNESGEPEIVYVDASHNIKVTTEEFLQMKQDIAGNNQKIDQLDKRWSPIYEFLKDNLPNFLVSMNDSSTATGEAVADLKGDYDENRSFIGVLAVIVMCSLVVVAFFVFMKRRQGNVKNIYWEEQKGGE